MPLLQRAQDVKETHLARNLVIGNEEYKRNFLQTFQGSTDHIISFHLQGLPQNGTAARLALTTLLRRKGRILDVLSETTRTLRERLNPTDQQVFDRLAALRTQIATRALSPQADARLMAQLTNEAEQQHLILPRLKAGEYQFTEGKPLSGNGRRFAPLLMLGIEPTIQKLNQKTEKIFLYEIKISDQTGYKPQDNKTCCIFIPQRRVKQ